jgi:hypothetical protein
MAQYTYKCVPVPETIGVGKKDSHAEVVNAYANIINEAAKGEWEYVGVDVISSVFSPGCIAGLFCQIPIINSFIRCNEAASFKVLVFKKLQ